MLALRFDGSLRLETEQPVPSPKRGEALIRVRMAGICRTDLELTRGYKGFCGTLGHEFVGEVAATSDSSWLGQRVCGEINIGCGACDLCGTLGKEHCRHRRVLGILGKDGAFAEYLTLPLANLHSVPDGLEDHEAVFAEPVAAALEILEQVRPSNRDTIVVLGDGKLGLLCAQVLKTVSRDVTLVGKHAEKLAVAAATGVKTAALSELEPASRDVVVEATGSATGLADALRLVRPRGTVVLKSTQAAASEVDLSPAVVNEITLLGSRCGPFDQAITALATGTVTVGPLVSATYPLGQGPEAFTRATQPEVLKVLLRVA